MLNCTDLECILHHHHYYVHLQQLQPHSNNNVRASRAAAHELWIKFYNWSRRRNRVERDTVEHVCVDVCARSSRRISCDSWCARSACPTLYHRPIGNEALEGTSNATRYKRYTGARAGSSSCVQLSYGSTYSSLTISDT
uniref:Uncharacterized protein n=1 Tax=Trichogramma kaykai TaxID=54128 RepID=A0ABD2W6B0_9HYME